MTIKLLYKYLEYDIEQLTHRYAEARVQNAEVKDLAQMDKNTSDANLSRRYILTGVGKLRIILKDYLDNLSNDADDQLGNADSWSFGFKEALADGRALAELMHWFVVKLAVYEWCRTFAPNESNAAKNELDDIEDDLENMLTDSPMPMKERRTEYQEDDMIIEVVTQYEE